MKFLDKLPRIFVERYLNTHSRYLKSIADIITHLYMTKLDDWEDTCSRMLLKLIPSGGLPRRRDIEDETVHFRNLRNCWYHECTLNYPLYDIDERMRFAAWKIIQLYYVVFSAVASLVCLDEPDRKSHDAVINRYMTDFVCSSRKRCFFLPPTNFHLNQQGVFSKEFSKMVNWKYADSYHLPTIEECLNYTKQQIASETNQRTINMRIGILHYLKTLRDWANYQDAYLFFRLYGDKVKFDLDFSLKRIAFIHCVQTEFFLLKTFGWKPLKLQFRTFRDQLRTNLHIKSLPLEGRFRIYSLDRKLFE